ncbi:MAG: hypothetical protein NPIRA03_24280 [Nitrospirales bacterium]|nr:MAG: hypothetical protein NPIRA03_24280 [Nitrospirales bacterium]
MGTLHVRRVTARMRRFGAQAGVKLNPGNARVAPSSNALFCWFTWSFNRLVRSGRISFNTCLSLIR